jgi:hypothetical protein
LARKYIPVKDAKESKLHLGRPLLYETFNVLVASVEMLAEALKNHLELPRGKILFICTTARIYRPHEPQLIRAQEMRPQKLTCL